MAPSRPTGTRPTSPDSLLVDAETQLQVGAVDKAILLATQALESTGSGGDHELRALNLLGISHVEAGEIDKARHFLERSVKMDEDGMLEERIGGGPEKFLLLAQLSQQGGHDSVQWYQRGAATLRRQLQALVDDTNPTRAQQASIDEKQIRLGGVLCAVAEVYMTDLSWEQDAEQHCESLVTEAMLIAPQSAETWQTVANVRISQERVHEAKEALRRSLNLWQHLPPEDPAVPEFPTRVSLARLLLETEMLDEALLVLERLVSDDDESVEAWYLGGWCLFITGQNQKQHRHQHTDDDGWHATWATARKWLAQCLKLYARLEYEDERLGEHAVELFQGINKELGEMTQGEEDSWEDCDSQQDELRVGHDDDEEMHD
ncbi:hypothetical protein CDD81_7775 [Ophiocordyceps australis]|uniref:Uncharacterized protein n=1 Tax=Ophiocordyceps australis TaxID=1399860 RepID=A0A2C5XZI6_9HYPO|nr:hypothetical protein CDD81_7775 [Ophiocordyceps australis]